MVELRLKKERKEREWTQQFVASKLEVSPQIVCDWEKGRRYPSYTTLLKLEKLFGLSHQKLFAPVDVDKPISSTN